MINAEKLKKLLKPCERLDMGQTPWPLPGKGDILRAECLYDLDPLSDSGYESLRRCITDVRVRKVEEASVMANTFLVYYEDILEQPIPGPAISKRPGGGRWSGIAFWNPTKGDSDKCIPLHAIKPSLLGEYAERLWRRAEGIERGLFS